MEEPGVPGEELVAVFRDDHAAEAAADAVRRMGVDPGRIRVGEEGDEVASLRAEMREEIEHTIAGPGSFGPFTKEMAKGAAAGVVLATVAGAVLALPLGLIDVGGLSLPARLVIAAVVGAAAGATLGFVLGGGLGAKGPGDKLAVERGVAVGVRLGGRERADEVVAALEEQKPIRLDVVSRRGQPIQTVTTEEEQDT